MKKYKIVKKTTSKEIASIDYSDILTSQGVLEKGSFNVFDSLVRDITKNTMHLTSNGFDFDVTKSVKNTPYGASFAYPILRIYKHEDVFVAEELQDIDELNDILDECIKATARDKELFEKLTKSCKK